MPKVYIYISLEFLVDQNGVLPFLPKIVSEYDKEIPLSQTAVKNPVTLIYI